MFCNDSHRKYYNDSLFTEAVNSVENDLENLWDLEKNMPKLDVNTPSYRHQMTTATTNKSNELALLGLREEMATRKFFSSTTDKFTCTNASINGESLCKTFKNISCKEYLLYRSYDGVCNNLKYPFDYGVSHKPFRRILPPEYADGKSSF